MDRKVKAAATSVVSNLSLLILKLVIGFITGSISVISTAVDSINDLSASIIAFFSVRASSLPADAEHPYGHGKLENISSAVQAFLIFTAAIYIIYEAINKILHPQPIKSIGLGIIVMGVTSFVDLFVSRYLLRVAEETESPAIRADAYHLTTDVWTSLSALVALALVKFTGIKLFDPIVAIGIAIVIIRVAYQLTRESAGHLMDISLPYDEISRLENILMNTKGVVGYHKLRSRKSGPYREIDYHLILPSQMPVIQSHNITREIERQMEDLFPDIHVITHVEPDTPEILSEPTTELRKPPTSRRVKQKPHKKFLPKHE